MLSLAGGGFGCWGSGDADGEDDGEGVGVGSLGELDGTPSAASFAGLSEQAATDAASTRAVVVAARR